MKRERRRVRGKQARKKKDRHTHTHTDTGTGTERNRETHFGFSLAHRRAYAVSLSGRWSMGPYSASSNATLAAYSSRLMASATLCGTSGMM